MLVHEMFSRDLRDHRAVARYAGLTGSPDESGSRRREKGLAKTGNARVRRGMIQLAWRFLGRQRPDKMVSGGRRRWQKTQEHDRSARPQAVDRTLAVRHNRRRATRRGAALRLVT
jgi:transposase